MDAVVNFFRHLGLSFIPLFVAIDAVGGLPLILGITKDEEEQQRARTLRYALLTAFALGLGFVALGKSIFAVLNIASSDFLIAGGIILLVLSVKDIITGKFIETGSGTGAAGQVVGVVPIGTPLIAGPATLTTLLVLIEQHGTGPVVVALLLNLLVAWTVFSQANRIARFLGTGGLQAAGKIASLLLAAIAVNMVRQGIGDV
ncbi:MAG: MarC family protein [Chloroflexi bacterium]|nr:MAG: MarC family protein [Chloroflexota bacterium]RLC94720.1 MAG: MarC family protein [Chloroflexota bacterium]